MSYPKEYQSPMGKVIAFSGIIRISFSGANQVSIPYGEGNRTTFCVVLQIIEQDIASLAGDQSQRGRKTSFFLQNQVSFFNRTKQLHFGLVLR